MLNIMPYMWARALLFRGNTGVYNVHRGTFWAAESAFINAISTTMQPSEMTIAEKIPRSMVLLAKTKINTNAPAAPKYSANPSK